MNQRLLRNVFVASGAIALALQLPFEWVASSQTTNSPTPTASAPPIATQVLSPNAYKVPYLGYDGIFHLNGDSQQSMNDPRNPKRIVIEKMEKFTFYKDTAGKEAIARNCHYAYLGAVPDAKYYPEYKTAVWDVFELEKDENEKQDPACNQFKYLAFQAPHGNPSHMHFRYGNDMSSFQTLVNMSIEPEDKAKFNPWWTEYCGGGKTACGKD